MTTLCLDSVAKSFNNRHVLRDVTLAATSGDVFGIVGPNGSGKSTLIRMAAGMLRPDAGTVTLTVSDARVPIEQHHLHVGVVAPYLRIYEEFTPFEHLHLQAKLRGAASSAQDIRSTLESVDLGSRQNDPIRLLSSGWRQRVLVALALHHKPAVLLLDEPTLTLDDDGRELVRHHVVEHYRRGGVVLLATNDERERQWCTTERSLRD